VGENEGKQFSGALPTSIQHGYNEIYGAGPDVDSTALMVSVTCIFCADNENHAKKFEPVVRRAISALARKDIDDDGLLEQGANEDWMDTMLRSGKIVYSQALWATALLNWSKLLEIVGESKEAEDSNQRYKRVLSEVNSKLWSEKNSCYFDLHDGSPSGGGEEHRVRGEEFVTQDISSFLLLEEKQSARAIKALDRLKQTLRKNLGPCCWSPPSDRTGPRKFKAYDYQNGGIWPWIASSEIMARTRHEQIEEALFLIRSIIPYSYVEWVNPHGTRGGSFPFRTGIAATRTALRNVLAKKNSGEKV
jgi:glycogen debranching enzyme